MQDSYFRMLFPPWARENDLKTKKAKEINFKKIGIPKSGISIGQLQLIFEKWAKEHPEDLNQTARLCLLLSLIDAYGWAYP